MILLILVFLNIASIFSKTFITLNEVQKSKNDKNQYKSIRLSNQMECLLISNPQVGMSSAGLSVAVGGFDDPFQKQGLAHYVQHLLFMGSGKYPEQEYFFQFIRTNSGHSNAYNYEDMTVYFFQISNQAFQQALDIWSQFFIDPLFSPGSVERELEAIQSQHLGFLQNDTQKQLYVKKSLGKPNHPFRKYFHGNKKFLKSQNLSGMAAEFFKTKYSANLMKLVVYSNKTIQELQNIVQDKFSIVKNYNYKKLVLEGQPYDQKYFQKVIKIIPVKDLKNLKITWILKDRSVYYRSRPQLYLIKLINYQGKNSLRQYLIEAGLAYNLLASSVNHFQVYSSLNIVIMLTQKGQKHYKTVIQHILFYIQKIRTSSLQKWVFQQIKTRLQMNSDYHQRQQGADYIHNLAIQLHKVKMQQIIVHKYIIDQWRPDLIQEYLNELKRQNMMVFMISKKYQNSCQLVQPIFGTKYGVFKLPYLQSKPFTVLFPKQNLYFPKKIDTFGRGKQKYPKLIVNESQFRIYFKQQHLFDQPKVIIKMNLYYNSNHTAKKTVRQSLFYALLDRQLKQFTYLGAFAQIQTSIEFDHYFNVILEAKGFTIPTMDFFVRYLEILLSFKPVENDYFACVKQSVFRAIKNNNLQQPLNVGYMILKNTLHLGNDGLATSPQLYEMQTHQLVFQDIIDFAEVWKKQLFVEMLISGNIDEATSTNFSKQIIQTVKKYNNKTLSKENFGYINTTKVSSQNVWVVQKKLTNRQEKSSLIIVYFEAGKLDQNQKILLTLITQWAQSIAFDYFRTKQQLGYTVFFIRNNNRQIYGASLMIQSEVNTTYELNSYIDTFFETILPSNLSKINQEDFDRIKNSKKSILENTQMTLSIQTQRFWDQISTQRYIFNYVQQQIESIEKLKVSDFKNLIQEIFYQNPRRLEIHITNVLNSQRNSIAKQKRLAKDKKLKIFNSSDYFKKEMEFYPDFQHFLQKL